MRAASRPGSVIATVVALVCGVLAVIPAAASGSPGSISGEVHDLQTSGPLDGITVDL
jgi:hypothetical protein